MRVHKSHFERVRCALVTSVVALLAAAPALAAEAARYKPTMADYLGVYDALQNYRNGVEKHDQKAAEKAFWEDGANIAVPTPGGPEIRLPLKEGGRGGPPGPNAGPPPGLAPPPGTNAGQSGPDGGPPPGFGPPPGANAGQPGPGGGRGAPNPAGGGTVVWHLPLDSYIHFESATRATHYEYFLSIYPQPEKQVDFATVPNASSSRSSIVGWPGHYEDILEKRNGEWRIFQRKSMINQK